MEAESMRQTRGAAKESRIIIKEKKKISKIKVEGEKNRKKINK